MKFWNMPSRLTELSYYLLHLMSPDIHLHKERGLLRYQRDDERRQLPLEDIRGVIIVTENITLTDRLIVALLENGAFILHCDKKYRPIGLTEPLPKIIKRDVAFHQARCTRKLQAIIWQHLLYAKIDNQRRLLKTIGARHGYLTRHLNNNKLNESACARYYWREFFAHSGFSGLTRRHDDEHEINRMLNYAYAVLGAICHRSIVAHGLSPLFGVHHRANFHNHPFVYDLIEPLRPFIDYRLYLYLTDESKKEKTIREWILFSQGCWDSVEVMHKQNRLKLIDAVDVFVSSVAKTFGARDTEHLWLPELQVR